MSSLVKSTAFELEQKIASLVDDSEFMNLHRRLSPFNLFEAVGAVRGELRHSNFVAFLLTPTRPHGVGSKVLQALLKSVLRKIPTHSRPLMTLELVTGDLDDAVVYRERGSIDILIELSSLNLVVAIENKVGSKASDGQLERYANWLKVNYPTMRHLLVFLKPDAHDPDHEFYVAYSYSYLVMMLEDFIHRPIEPIPSETRLIIEHYIAIVRRHVVADDKLKALAVKLYEQHKQAFDYIFECRPEASSLLSVIRENIDAHSELTIDSGGASILRFVPSAWDQKLKNLRCDTGKWSRTGRGILFEVKKYSGSSRINVSLVLGPAEDPIRRHVYEAALRNPQLFKGLVKPMGVMYASIYSNDLQTNVQGKDRSFEEQVEAVQQAWENFISNDLGQLTEQIAMIDRDLSEI